LVFLSPYPVEKGGRGRERGGERGEKGASALELNSSHSNGKHLAKRSEKPEALV
jgi:hypothetical protein